MSATGEWNPDEQGIRKAPVEFAKRMWTKAKKVHATQAGLSLLATLIFIQSPL